MYRAHKSNERRAKKKGKSSLHMRKRKETLEEKDGKKRKKNAHSAPIGTFANSGKLPVWIACASPNAAERWLMALPQVLQKMRVTAGV
jgi:hypothetical protein